MRNDPAARPGLSRRRVMKIGTGLVAGVAVSGALSGPAVSAEGSAANAAPRASARVMLKGGTIITMDPKIGDIAKGDLLIEGKKIAYVGNTLDAADAQVIDATHAILIPGFVD